MASSNVDYYTRQKELQDIMHEHEQKRIHLEQQFKSYCKKDDRLAKLRATKLQTYWKKICEDQRRSHIRNQQIIRDFERVDSHLATLTAKTERLRLLKRQYEDYIEKTYPQWRQKVLNIGVHQQDERAAGGQQQVSNGPQNASLSQQTPHEAALEQQFEFKSQQQEQQQQQHYIEQTTSFGSQYHDQQRESQQELNGSMGESSLPHRSYYMEEAPVDHTAATPQKSDIVVPTHHAPKTSNTSTPIAQRKADQEEQMKSAVYANMSEVTRDADVTHYVDSMRQRTPSPYQSSNVSPQPVRLRAERDTDIHTEVQIHPYDVSASEENLEVAMSQPIQSITVKGPGIVSQAHEVEASQSSGAMEPEQEEEEEEDDDSEFGDDIDLPLSGQQGIPPGQQQQIAAAAAETASLESSPDEEEIPQIKASIQPKRASPSPELSATGIIRLIQHVQNDFLNAISLEGYYRSHPPTAADRLDILQKANDGQNLDGLHGVLVSMVVLEQVTLVIRSLRNECLLPDSILSGSVDTVTQTQIRAMLLPDAQPLWDCLFDHLIKLVKEKVMIPNEVAAVFVPCIVSDRSQYQDKAFSLLLRLITEQVAGKSDMDVGTPRDGLDSVTRSSMGGVEIGPDGKVSVPPLKFGSLVQSQYSDDDTSQMTQSVTSQKIPLNATEAYRSMVSGSVKQQPQHVGDDEEEDTDEDVEKQFASTLSPRSASSPTKKPATTFANSSKLPPPQPTHEPLSDSSSILTSQAGGPVYVPTAVEHDSAKPTPRSVGYGKVNTPRSSSQPQRKPGIHIHSDLDTDTELDILKQPSEGHKEDEDFYDFYE